MEEEQLTKDWIEFDGDYVKAMQDIKLKNGDVVTMCWPNAGFWCVCRKKGNEKYYQKDIPVKEATHVRLTHDPQW